MFDFYFENDDESRLTASGRVSDPSLDDSGPIFGPEKSSRVQKLELTGRVGSRSWN